jgi:hypothetical protein
MTIFLKKTKWENQELSTIMLAFQLKKPETDVRGVKYYIVLKSMFVPLEKI